MTFRICTMQGYALTVPVKLILRFVLTLTEAMRSCDKDSKHITYTYSEMFHLGFPGTAVDLI